MWEFSRDKPDAPIGKADPRARLPAWHVVFSPQRGSWGVLFCRCLVARARTARFCWGKRDLLPRNYVHK